MKSNNQTTKIAGLRYLITMTVRVLAKAILFKLIPSEHSPVLTKRNMVSEWIFSTGYIDNKLVQVIDAVMAMTMFILLKPVDRMLELLFMIFRMMNIAMHCINLLNCFFSVRSGGDAGCLTVSRSEHYRSMHPKSMEGVPMQLVMG